MAEGRKTVDPERIDDDNPEWTADDFARARSGRDVFAELGMTPPRRGRPRSASAKKQVTLRLDPDVLEGWRATGEGWQSRMNHALRRALEEGKTG